MDFSEFRRRGEELVDYIVDYLESITQRPVAPFVSPGFLLSLLPSSAPQRGESFETIMEDFEKYVMPGIMHWQHPRFNAYFPADCSYPAILAQMISDAVGCVGYPWDISPAEKELEAIVVDWFGRMIGLPEPFLCHADGSEGGGTVENSCSECVLMCMIAARGDALTKLKSKNPSVTREELLPTLVAYCSRESHSSVEKAAVVSMVTMKVLDVDENFRLRGHTLEKAVEEDKEIGLVPFFACITIGTTSCGSIDAVDEIGPVCAANDMWLHIDAAYGGAALMCPEYKHILKGVENASSFNVNAAKWMLSHIGCSVLWARDRSKFEHSLVTDETRYSYTESECGLPGNRTNRVLRLWFVIRNFGVRGLQSYVRNHVRLAKMFEKCVRDDDRFEVVTCEFGLVCFRLKASNSLNKKLVMAVNSSGKLHITGCTLDGRYIIRFCISLTRSNEDDIRYSWSVFTDFASELLEVEEQSQ